MILNRLLAVIALVFSAQVLLAQESGLMWDTADLPKDKSWDGKIELKKYEALTKEVKEKSIHLDPMFVVEWSAAAKAVKKAKPAGTASNKDESILGFFNLFVADRSLEKDNMIVIQCCHKIKEGKICSSLNPERQKDLVKCEEAHKK